MVYNNLIEKKKLFTVIEKKKKYLQQCESNPVCCVAGEL